MEIDACMSKTRHSILYGQKLEHFLLKLYFLFSRNIRDSTFFIAKCLQIIKFVCDIDNYYFNATTCTFFKDWCTMSIIVLYDVRYSKEIGVDSFCIYMWEFLTIQLSQIWF